MTDELTCFAPKSQGIITSFCVLDLKVYLKYYGVCSLEVFIMTAINLNIIRLIYSKYLILLEPVETLILSDITPGSYGVKLIFSSLFFLLRLT